MLLNYQLIKKKDYLKDSSHVFVKAFDYFMG